MPLDGHSGALSAPRDRPLRAEEPQRDRREGGPGLGRRGLACLGLACLGLACLRLACLRLRLMQFRLMRGRGRLGGPRAAAVR